MPQSDRPNRTQQPSSPSSPPSPSISPAQSAQQKKSSGHLPVIRKPRRTCQTRLPVLPLCARQSGVLRLSLPLPAALNGNRTIFFSSPFSSFFYVQGFQDMCVRHTVPNIPKMLPIVPYTMSKMAAVSLLLVCLCVYVDVTLHFRSAHPPRHLMN